MQKISWSWSAKMGANESESMEFLCGSGDTASQPDLTAEMDGEKDG